MQNRLVDLVIAAALVLGGCGKDSPTGAGATSEDPVTSEEVRAVQAKVPDGVAVTFEAVKGEKDRHLAIQPKGWETGVIPGRLKPPAGSDLGFMTVFSTGSNCDGECTAKDWAKVVDAVELGPLKASGGEVAKDEELPGGGRLVVVSRDGRTDIVLARWKEGASRYFVCRVILDRELTAAAAAFEEACRQMRILAWQ